MMVRWVFVGSALPVLLACSAPQGAGDEVGQIADAQAETFKDDDVRGEASRDFAYDWPAQVSAVPRLAAMLGSQREEELATQSAEWQQSIEEFGDMGCITCINRSYSKTWNVAADTPHLLVLRAEIFSYTGGAHGNSNFDALLWDRQANDGAGEAMRPIALFVNEVTIENIANGEYCQALLEARGERLEMNIEGLNKFEDCPSVADLVVVPTSSDGLTLDRIEFLAAPYVAGSFAEGPYEFAIPMTSALIEAVRPEYRASFSVND